MLALFFAFSMRLDRSSETILTQMAALPPRATPSLFVPKPEPEPEPEPAPKSVVEEPPTPSPEVSPIESFVAFLQPEVEEGLVHLYRDGDAVLVRIANSGVFDVADATINPAFINIFERIGQALAAEDFDATVLGHTDSRPIRTAQFPSNLHLSTARANAVRDILEAYTKPGRVDIRGEADLSPVADNSTAKGREANRRTEVVVRGVGERVPPSLLQQGRIDLETDGGVRQ